MFYHRDMIAILQRLKPESILAIFPSAERILEEYAHGNKDAQIEYYREDLIKGKHLPEKRFRIILIAETLEYLDKHDAEALISRFRDINSEILYVVVPVGTSWTDHTSQWNHTDLIALAFRHIKRYIIGGKQANLYYYDIYNYKHTPDWLNSKYWANPEMWNKGRW